jgi:large subunit ribosomal protein L21
MIAVAKIGGHQAIVKVGEILRVDKLDVEVGKMAQFETYLTSDEDGKNCTIGTPMIEGSMVEAKVLQHGRADKIKIYKMNPRKRYRRTQGHRQDYTEIEITSVGGSAAKAKPAAKEAVKAEKIAVSTAKSKKEEAESKSAPAKKAPAAKKPAAKKVVKKD